MERPYSDELVFDVDPTSLPLLDGTVSPVSAGCRVQSAGLTVQATSYTNRPPVDALGIHVT